MLVDSQPDMSWRRMRVGVVNFSLNLTTRRDRREDENETHDVLVRPRADDSRLNANCVCLNLTQQSAFVANQIDWQTRFP